MPLYEYQCEKCGKTFEVIEKFSAEPLVVHENCGGAVHRLISTSALQFKGSGFYITDYAKESKSGTNAPAAKGDANTGTKGNSDGGQKSSDSTSSTSGDKGSTTSSSESKSSPSETK